MAASFDSERDGGVPLDGDEGAVQEPLTARDESAEPSGEEDPANEAQREAETERSEAVEAVEPDSDDPLAGVERERDEYLDLARRTQADFENYRKRAAREAAAAG